MNKQPTIVAIIVAKNTPLKSIPVWLRTLGFKMMIYAIVKKVVKPARVSVK